MEWSKSPFDDAPIFQIHLLQGTSTTSDYVGDEDDVLSILVLGLGISIVFCLFQRLHLCYSSMRRGDASVAPAGKFVGVGQLRDDEVNFAEAKLC